MSMENSHKSNEFTAGSVGRETMLNGAQHKIDVIVSETTLIATDVKGIKLTALDYNVLPPASPGSHIDLWLSDGTARQYSVIRTGSDGASYQIAVLRAPCSRGGSAYIVDQLQIGARLRLSGPRNNFPLNEGNNEYILVAGGIGITPILPMALRLAAIGKPFAFHYLARSRDRAALLDVIEHGSLKNRVKLHFSDVQGKADLLSMLGRQRQGVHIYVCGPSRLIDGILDATRGWPAGAVHFERFSVQTNGVDRQSSYEVELAKSGKVLTVAQGQSILQVLRKEGVHIESVCRQGICGTCAVDLLSGEVDHRDAIQTDDEKAQNQTIYVCVSHARSERIVLDL
jgi:ferredoxin-NADP reductase